MKSTVDEINAKFQNVYKITCIKLFQDKPT